MQQAERIYDILQSKDLITNTNDSDFLWNANWSDPKDNISIKNMTKIKEYIQEKQNQKQHPISRFNLDLDESDIKPLIKIWKENTMVQGVDLITRIYFRTLPMGDVFGENCQLCTLNTSESYKHLFWDCISFKELIGPYLFIFGSIMNPSFESTLDPRKIKVLPSYFPINQYIIRLWLAIFIACAQTQWFHHCQIKYEDPNMQIPVKHRTMTLLQLHIIRFSTHYKNDAQHQKRLIRKVIFSLCNVDSRFKCVLPLLGELDL